ncbi:MAG: TrmH family RNA methyltransferase [Pseudomonadota bacterium]
MFGWLEDDHIYRKKMDTFGFTKKKFQTLSRQNQHQHMIIWLSDFYQTITTNRLNQQSFNLFSVQYRQILDWARMKPFARPESDQPRAWLETVSDRIHYHRTAMGMTCRDQDLLEKINAQDRVEPRHSIHPDCHVALDSLRSLFNTGSIIRTCEAAGFKSVILGNMPGQDHPGIQKTAMGADQWIAIEQSTDLAQTLLEKKKAGYTIIGVETIQNSHAFDDILWKDQTILVFGNEEYGISAHVMEMCDLFIHIPMFGRKNSINVANAVSVVCFHAAQSLAALNQPSNPIKTETGSVTD